MIAERPGRVGNIASEGLDMKALIIAAGLAGTLALGLQPAAAAGCLSGAAVGGIAGHVAGHHGILGAAAGCAIGHHEANKSRRASNANMSRAQSGDQTSSDSTR
jgi:hypothetical protein